MATVSLDYDVQRSAHVGAFEVQFSAGSETVTWVYGNSYRVGATPPSAMSALVQYPYTTEPKLISEAEYVAVSDGQGSYALVQIIDSQSRNHGGSRDGVILRYATLSTGVTTTTTTSTTTTTLISRDTTPPTVPTGLTANAASATQIKLIWTSSADNLGAVYYKLYRSTVLIKSLTMTSFIDTGLSPDTTYSYAVAACDAAGNCSGPSASVAVKTSAAADTLAPTTPTGLTAGAPTNSGVTLTWSASTDNTAVTSYKVYVGDSVADTLGNVTDYSVKSLTSATSYAISVAACDAAGNCSARSTPVTVTTLPSAAPLPPTVPTGVSASASGSAQITLTWKASTSAGGTVGYKVYRGTALIGTTSTTAYTDTGLNASTTYSYSVSACDLASNCSLPSSAVSATTQSTVNGATSISTREQSDCLFSSLEASYPPLFAPSNAQSMSFGPYYLRAYSKTNSYLAVWAENLMYLGPLSGGALLNLGPVSTWYASAGCK